MSTYNNTFDGNFIQPSTVSYKNIVVNSNIELTWPTNYQDTPNDYVSASYMTVQAALQAEVVIDLGNNPIETEVDSAIVTVTIPSDETTENLFTGTPITINGSTDVNGISANELNITTNILEIINSESFTYTSNGMADADGEGGGEDVVLTYNVPLSIKLPDATKVSIGTSLHFINNGDNPFFISDNGKNFIVTLEVGNVYQLLLTDNSTVAGEWQVLQAGTGTASSNAYQLTGLGLKVLNGTLNTNFPSKLIQGDYTSTAADRSSLIVWGGGAGNIDLFTNPLPGFSQAINNSGSGLLTVSTPEGVTIDGKESFPLNPGESAQFINTSSTTWNTLGFGKDVFFSVDTLSLSIAAGGNITLTNEQSSKLIQTYTGALAQNAIVNFPAATGQWYVWNNTTNNFSVTLKLAGIEGGVLVPQGEKIIVYSDGTNLYSTPTTATNAVFNPGNEGTPTIIFTNDATTGFYSAGVGDFGFSSGGTLTLELAPYGLGIRSGNEARFFNPVNTFYAALKAGNMAANISWRLPLADATNSGQIIYSDATRNLSFTQAAYPTSTTINQLLYSSADNTVTGLATVENGVLVTDDDGVPSVTQNPIGVPLGGSGLSTLTTAYGVICAGTTPTGNFQNAGAGNAGQVFVSNGNAALPGFQNYLPIGTIIEYAGTVDIPMESGWVECDFRELSRVTYAGFFAVIGTTYGNGNGSTTFNVPDKRGRTSVGIGSDNSTGGRITNATAPEISLGKGFGSETQTLNETQIPPHSHVTNTNINETSSFQGGTGTLTIYSAGGRSGNTGGGQPHPNVQPSIFLRYFIRWL